MNNDYYKTIQGWFDFEAFYDMAISRVSAEEDSVFVEVGSWLGKSTCYLANRIKISNKPITLFAVDTWAGSENEEFHQQVVGEHGGSIYDAFLANMYNGGVSSHVIPFRNTSVEAALSFNDDSIDMVYIDANHSEIEVLKDIDAWYPKVKPGGLIGGHDYHKGWGKGVVAAVDARFPNCHKMCNSTWYFVKK